MSHELRTPLNHFILPVDSLATAAKIDFDSQDNESQQIN